MTKPGSSSDTPRPTSPPPRPIGDFVWLAAYIVILILIAAGIFAFRSWTFATYASNDAVAEWDAWRREATEMSKQPGPVKRKPPKSVEPPGLILVRDFFPAVLVGGVVLSGILSGVILLMLRGTFAGGGKFIDRSTPEALTPRRK